MYRPPHLRQRPITGRAFGKPATLIRTGGSWADGVWVETETPSAIFCATAPVEAVDPRARQLTEGGVQLDAARLFWTAEELQPQRDDSAGDLIVYGGQRYRVRETQPWEGFWEALAVRQEGQ